MLNSLPDELLHDIMPHEIPDDDGCAPSAERRAPTLRALSLVSPRLKLIAQPLLFKGISIKSPQQLEGIVNLMARHGWNSTMREVTIADCEQHEFGSELLERFLREAGQGLQVLEISRSHGRLLNLAVLQELPNLDTLHLQGSRYLLPRPILLNTLRTLQFSDTSIIAPLLDPVYLPSLESLSLFAVETQDDADILSASRAIHLVPQLYPPEFDNVTAIDLTPTILRPIFARTLFYYDFNTPSFSSSWMQVPVELRIDNQYGNSASDTSDFRRLRRLTSALNALNADMCNLRILILDVTMEEPCLTDEGWRYWDAFEDALLNTGIRIVYEDQWA